MCSIAGFMSKKPIDRVTAGKLASALIFYGQERGEQSAGAFVVGKEEKIYKRACHPETLIMDKGFRELFDDHTVLGLLHTRMPTSGGREDRHAQPFRRGDTVTVHNGWYTQPQYVKNLYNIKKKTDVDSELVTAFIESYGIDMLPDFLEEAWGSSAIAAYHKGELYLCRDSNPLHYANVKFNGNRIMVFASTKSQLDYSIKFVKLAYDTKIQELRRNRLYLVRNRNLIKIGDFTGDICSPCDSYYQNGYGSYSHGGNYTDLYDHETKSWVKMDANGNIVEDMDNIIDRYRH